LRAGLRDMYLLKAFWIMPVSPLLGERLL